ncbi:MAG: tetratricopeptide repeat protein [Alphaproteobacteria bacterium]|nr:tetratricopeptide repeat protein [Alphaproteobacteria bacterium]
MVDPYLLSAKRFLDLGDARGAEELARQSLAAGGEGAGALHLLAESLRRQGRLEEAGQAFKDVLKAQPENGGAWLGLGLVAEAGQDTQRAGEAFAKAVQFLPDSLEARLGLASAHQAQGRGIKAAEAWLEAWLLKPKDFRLHNILWQALNEIVEPGEGYVGAIARGNAARAQGMSDEALAGYRSAQALRPDLPFAHSRAGCLLAAAGDLQGAEAEFLKARELADWVETGIRLSPEFFQGLGEHRSGLEILNLAPVSGPVVVVGCDAGYFARYAATLHQSLVRCEDGKTGLHVHLVHPDAASLEAARAMGAGISLETPEFGGCSRNFVNTYFASARFLALPRLLEAYDRPLLVMDVDAVVLKPLAPLWATLLGADMAIRRLKGSMVDPWNLPQANLVGVNPTPGGKRFADLLARYLAHFVAKRQMFGFFDQTALYSVLAAGLSLKEGVFPDDAYGYPSNRGALFEKLVYPPNLIVGEVKTPAAEAPNLVCRET